MSDVKKGFTLVELLVVVAILGVLAAVGIVSFGGYMSRTKVTAIKNQVNDVAKFIQLKMTECSMNPGSMNLHTPDSWDQFLTNPGHCVNSSMEQMKAGIYNHINDTWNQFNVYEKKTPALYSGPYNTNPSQGYINFGFFDQNGRKYFILYANLGDHLSNTEKYYSREIDYWE